MEQFKYIAFLTTIYLQYGVCWFFSKNIQPDEQPVVVKKSVPFEVKDVDDSFLQAANGLTQLDRCHHLVSLLFGETNELNPIDLSILSFDLVKRGTRFVPGGQLQGPPRHFPYAKDQMFQFPQ